MKKICFKLLLILTLTIPINVIASKIDSYFVDAVVLENGDMSVKELIILESENNWFERILKYKNNDFSEFNYEIPSLYSTDIYNANNVQLVAIKGIEALEKNNFGIINTEGEPFKEVPILKKSSKNKYSISFFNETYEYKMATSNKNRLKGFYIEYIIKDLAVLHNDSAEIYTNLFENIKEPINYLEMHLSIPNNEMQLNGWIHGALMGNVSIENRNYIKITASNIESNETLNVRFIFDKYVLTSSNKKSNENLYNKIIDEEEQKQIIIEKKRKETISTLIEEANNYVSLAESNKNRENYNRALEAINYLPETVEKNNFNHRLKVVLDNIMRNENKIRLSYIFISIGWMMGVISLIIYFYINHNKGYESKFKANYYKEIPKNYGPEIVSYLLNKNITNHDLSACLINLIDKNIITYEKKKKNYIFTPNKIYRDCDSNEEITEQEKKLIEILFNWEAKTLEKIKEGNNKNYKQFLIDIKNWKKLVINEAQKNNFFENLKRKKILNIIYLALGLIILAIYKFNPYYTYSGLNIIIIFTSLISIIYITISYKRTHKANEEYRKWLSLKKFLNAFDTTSKGDLPEPQIIEKYLVYSLPLGCSKKLFKDIETRIDNLYEEEYSNKIKETIEIYSNICDTINTSITSSRNLLKIEIKNKIIEKLKKILPKKNK